MTIKIVPTVDDLVAFAIYESWRSPGARHIRRQRYLLVLVIALALIAGTAWRLTQPGGMDALVPDLQPVEAVLVVVAGAGLAWSLVWSLFLKNTPAALRRTVCDRIERFPQEFRQVLAPRELTIADWGTRVAGDGFEFKASWDHVTDVLRDRDRAYLVYATKRVEIVRAAVLGTNEEFNEFLATIRRYRVSAALAPPEETAPKEGPGVRFTPNADDIAALQDYFYKRVRPWGAAQWVIAGGLACVCFVLSGMMVIALWKGDWTTEITLVMSVLFVLWVFIVVPCGLMLAGGSYSIRRRHLRGALDRNPAHRQFYQRPARILCDKQGMRIFVDGIEEFLAWQRIPNVVEEARRGCLFICTLFHAQNVHAVIVPRRAFDSEFAFADFCHRTMEFWRTANSPSSSVHDGQTAPPRVGSR